MLGFFKKKPVTEKYIKGIGFYGGFLKGINNPVKVYTQDIYKGDIYKRYMLLLHDEARSYISIQFTEHPSDRKFIETKAFNIRVDSTDELDKLIEFCLRD